MVDSAIALMIKSEYEVDKARVRLEVLGRIILHFSVFHDFL